MSLHHVAEDEYGGLVEW